MTTHEESRPSLPMPVKATPYRHQQEAFGFVCRAFGLLPEPEAGPPVLKSSGCALLMEMGTGKTITSIAITGALAEAGRIGRVLIVAPLSMRGYAAHITRKARRYVTRGSYRSAYWNR